MIPFILELTMTAQEDLHIGNGLAHLGEYDSGHATDRNGDPWVPHTTLMGMAREGCRKVLTEYFEKHYLQQSYFDELFNFAKGDSLLLEPLLMTNISSFDKGPFIIRPFTAVELGGKARDHSLRSLQCVRKDAQFKGSLYGCVSDNDALVFLQMGIKRIRRMGGNRNRGLGKVSFKITPDKSFNVKAHCIDPALSVRQKDQDDGEGSYLMLRCRLKDMVNIGSRSQANNILFTRDYIRSENILGAWRHILRTHILPEAGTDLDDALAILDDAPANPSFSSLYPMPNVNKDDFDALTPLSIIPLSKSLTLPKSSDLKYLTRPAATEKIPNWFSAKSIKDLQSLKARDNLITRDDDDHQRQKDATAPKFKTVSGFLHHKAGPTFEMVKSPLTRNLRNRVVEKFGNVRDDGLFVEECIKEETEFLGWIRFPSHIQKKEFEALFSYWLPGGNGAPARLPLGIGRGRKVMLVTQAAWQPDTSSTSSELIDHTDTSPGETYIHLLLLSDAVFLDKKGRGVTRLTGAALAAYLGLSPKVTIEIERRFETAYPYMAMHSSGGFFTPAMNVIEKGSAYRIKFSDRDKAAIRKALWERFKKGQGLGEYTQKGYGRFALNHPVHQLYEQWDPQTLATDSFSIAGNELSQGREHQHREAKTFFQKKLKRFPGKLTAKLSSFLAFLESSPSDDDIKNAFVRLKRQAQRPTEKFWNETVDKTPIVDILKDYRDNTSADQLAVALRYWLYEHRDN